jgi:mediator of replication checkpoint protein 1
LTMASSRASSPMASQSTPGSPEQLSPRSKVRAMLAALDDNSDGEEISTLAKPDFLSNSEATQDLNDNEEQNLEANADNVIDEIEDEEDDGPVKPRGRLAARMNAGVSQINREDSNETYTARERVKKMLLAETTKSTEVTNNESEDEDTPVASRKRKIRTARASTPESSPVRQSSPMFVSPTSNGSERASPNNSGSEADLPSNPTSNARFMALVAKKREERLAKEEENDRKKAEKAAERKKLSQNHSDMLEHDALDGSEDENGGRRLTQQVRPTRKASKKALEDISRESQRMSRNMQLAHEARTKKKITKSSLFAKFNYKPAGFAEEEDMEPIRPTSSSSALQTDQEAKDTPPTSPSYHSDSIPKAGMTENAALETDTVVDGGNSDTEIPILSDALSRPIPSSPPTLMAKIDKGKGKAIEVPAQLPDSEAVAQSKALVFTQKPIRIRPPKVLETPAFGLDESDSDLEIVAKTPARKTKESIFDRVPAKQGQESHSLHALRMLAHLTSPGKEIRGRGRNAKPSMTATELTMSLQQRARQQATREREERLQNLRDRGIIVQTTEEREKEMAEVEDMIAKARREGEEIMQKERAALKKERKANGEVDPLGDSSDDEEWQEEKETFAEEMAGSGSGSGSDEDADGEESGEDELDSEEDEDDIPADEELDSAGILIDNEAADSETDEEDNNETTVLREEAENADFIDDEEDEELPATKSRRRTNQQVLSDEDEEDKTPARRPLLPHTDSPVAHHTNSPIAPTSVLRSATKTFIPGLTVAGPAGLGLTQIFAGTMDDSQSQPFDGSPIATKWDSRQLDNGKDSMAFLRNLPAPSLPTFEPTLAEDSQDIVKDSQSQITQALQSQFSEAETQGIQLNYSQSQVHGFDSLVDDPFATQLSQFPESTQDEGFQAMSPIKGRFVEPPPSTIDTVIRDDTPIVDRVDESPVAKKKGKLRRRPQMPAFSDDEEEAPVEPVVQDDEFDISANVFNVMRKAARRKEVVDEFDKKKSGAKEMVQEQADESEDEYAGLGGVSDDESGGEEDAYVKEMIDDEAGKDADAGKLAAFYA